MKKPLSYQITEYDSLATSIINALKYTLDKKAIPVEVVNSVFELTFKRDNSNISEFITWLDEYNIASNLGVKFSRIQSSEMNEENVANMTKSGGVIISRCYGNQFVLVTGIDEFNTYLFDPYYLDMDFHVEDEDYKIISDEPFKYNRIVHNNRFFSNEDKTYSLTDEKECILVESTFKEIS